MRLKLRIDECKLTTSKQLVFTIAPTYDCADEGPQLRRAAILSTSVCRSYEQLLALQQLLCSKFSDKLWPVLPDAIEQGIVVNETLLERKRAQLQRWADLVCGKEEAQEDSVVYDFMTDESFGRKENRGIFGTLPDWKRWFRHDGQKKRLQMIVPKHLDATLVIEADTLTREQEDTVALEESLRDAVEAFEQLLDAKMEEATTLNEFGRAIEDFGTLRIMTPAEDSPKSPVDHVAERFEDDCRHLSQATESRMAFTEVTTDLIAMKTVDSLLDHLRYQASVKILINQTVEVLKAYDESVGYERKCAAALARARELEHLEGAEATRVTAEWEHNEAKRVEEKRREKLAKSHNNLSKETMALGESREKDMLMAIEAFIANEHGLAKQTVSVYSAWRNRHKNQDSFSSA